MQQNFKPQADGELSEAMPAMKAAAEAVDCLDKNSIGELKALASRHLSVLMFVLVQASS